MAGGGVPRSRACCSNDPQFDEHHADESNAYEAHVDEDTINEDDAGARPKKKRGPTMATNLWSYTDALKTGIYDDDGQPVGGEEYIQDNF